MIIVLVKMNIITFEKQFKPIINFYLQGEKNISNVIIKV